MADREELELQEYRSLMETPTEYQDGFGWNTVVGAFFIGLVMMPGSIYLSLMTGASMGPAAEWVTIILFIEVAKRSFQVMSRQEVYVLYYIAGGLTAVIGVVHLAGGPFGGLIWAQYLRTSAPSDLIAQVPNWVAPPPDSPGIQLRSFFHRDWWVASPMGPIMLMLIGQVLSRLAWLGFGYTLFRVTSDGEQLPFPMAPIAAQGATALAESSSKQETWRWRIFSMATMMGIGFGAIYVGIPALSGVMLVRPIQILPIPWIDFTQGTERFLPAAPVGIMTNMGTIFTGFVLPYWMTFGSFAAAMVTIFLNPVLQITGLLPTWQPGMDTIATQLSNGIDFWISFGIGTAFAVAALGFWKMYNSLRQARREGRGVTGAVGPDKPERGDVPVKWAVVAFLAATVGYVLLCRLLVPDFKLLFIVFFGFIWTPLQSYVNARMIGLTGQFIAFPFVREATFILSGYQGVKIWFAPIPIANYGVYAQKFREVELTGTKFTSIVKAELLMMPMMLVCGFLYWTFVWRLNPIPSVAYPYCQKIWPYQARMSWIWMSATTGGETAHIFRQTIKPGVIAGGLGFGLVSYAMLMRLGWPVLLIYGFIRGLGMFPHEIIPQMAGAVLGRYYFSKRFGEKNWRQYTPVLAAGFACGMGLIAMGAIAIALISQSIKEFPF